MRPASKHCYVISNLFGCRCRTAVGRCIWFISSERYIRGPRGKIEQTTRLVRRIYYTLVDMERPCVCVVVVPFSSHQSIMSSTPKKSYRSYGSPVRHMTEACDNCKKTQRPLAMHVLEADTSRLPRQGQHNTRLLFSFTMPHIENESCSYKRKNPGTRRCFSSFTSLRSGPTSYKSDHPSHQHQHNK